ncbi:hypothetical protein GCM10025864_18500 [Luteimicrobium album]|uniref:Uncharacterized protein n=1 Tax=Luteimicrobium album TaxID=1054550 RepID=A0ABQ6I1I2_9MICO|nr:hypothetical protein GCM10025864_18500 [Luteimicrobium album]
MAAATAVATSEPRNRRRVRDMWFSSGSGRGVAPGGVPVVRAERESGSRRRRPDGGQHAECRGWCRADRRALAGGVGGRAALAAVPPTGGQSTGRQHRQPAARTTGAWGIRSPQRAVVGVM